MCKHVQGREQLLYQGCGMMLIHIESNGAGQQDVIQFISGRFNGVAGISHGNTWLANSQGMQHQAEQVDPWLCRIWHVV